MEKYFSINFTVKLIRTEFAKLRAYASNPSLIRACAPLPTSIGTLCAFALSCGMLLQLKDKVSFVCTQIKHSPFVFLSSLLFYHVKLFYMFFFFCFKSLVTPLFVKLFPHFYILSSVFL